MSIESHGNCDPTCAVVSFWAVDLPEQWALIEADLERARNTLPQEAATSAPVRYYQEFLNHNELELACDMLEAYAEDHLVSKEFWIALSDAATKMKLPSATRYTKFAESIRSLGYECQ